jgi:phage tail protein X
MTTYITRDGDTVDYITWKFYGYQDRRAVEQVLEANHGLAEYGPTLPPGLRVELPAQAPASIVQGTKLWD